VGHEPRVRLFRCGAGTNEKSNPNALASTREGTIFTNVALNLDDNTVWWEGLDKNPPQHALDWLGNPWNGTTSAEKGAPPTPASPLPPKTAPASPRNLNAPPACHLRHRFRRRRAKTAPLVYQSRDWDHGVFVGSIMAPRPPQPPPARWAWSAGTLWPCSPSAAITWPTTGSTGWTWARCSAKRPLRSST
jgi:phosphoenolpyruvate carboxykinase (GTP)